MPMGKGTYGSKRGRPPKKKMNGANGLKMATAKLAKPKRKKKVILRNTRNKLI